MKTKLITLTWRGCASVDPRFSSSMLSWSIADIRTREYSTRVSPHYLLFCYINSENLRLLICKIGFLFFYIFIKN